MTAALASSALCNPFGDLRDPTLLRGLAYVDGMWIGTGCGTFAVTNPATLQTIASVASLDQQHTNMAIEAAANAFIAWRALAPQERAAKLRRWYELMLAAKEDLSLLVTLEQGKPLGESRGEIEYAASFVEWYAEEARRLQVEGVSSHLPGAEMHVRREPLGVVGIVTPWNFPAAMITRKAAAALAAGCTVVAHPSSETPLSALALAVLADRAGIPPGVFNVVTGKPGPIVGAMSQHSLVRAMSFTGSTRIGQLIATQAAATLKRLVMELGGHAPLIIFADADLERAVEIAVAAKFATSGQDCLAANRIFVERPLLQRFTQAFAARIASLKVGAGLTGGVEIGPLINEAAVSKMERHVADALERGARLVVGGRRHPAGPLFFEPTLLTDLPDDALLMREETFGPIAALSVFDTEAEVTARANDTEYGLVAYVVTNNGARQLRLGRALEYGMIAINRVKITGAPIPFGGWKQSGLGREGSRHGMEAFCELKYLCIDTNA